jgi:rod shape-determining protein MreC
MAAIPTRHRSLTLFAFVVGAQLLLLAVQIKRESQVRLIRVWAVETASPVGRTAAWTSDGIGGIWNNYIALWHTRQENQELQADLNRLKLRNAELEGRAAEADRLAELLSFRQEQAAVPMLAARVIGGSPDAASHAVFINRGARDGLKRDFGVITPEGVVGKIVAVFPDTSQVLLLDDRDSGVGALLASSRTQSPVRGTGDPLLDMEYVSVDTKVEPGEVVLTSGQDRIFPKDLPVGTVAQVKPDPHGTFQEIRIRPAAHLDRLEEVLVLLSREELAPKKAPSETQTTPAVGGPSATRPAEAHPTPASASAAAKNR